LAPRRRHRRRSAFSSAVPPPLDPHYLVEELIIPIIPRTRHLSTRTYRQMSLPSSRHFGGPPILDREKNLSARKLAALCIREAWIIPLTLLVKRATMISARRKCGNQPRGPPLPSGNPCAAGGGGGGGEGGGGEGRPRDEGTFRENNVIGRSSAR
jgi:hypothetical protein